MALSSPDLAWTFGNDNVVTYAAPLPCAESDSKEIPYVSAALDIVAKDARLDESKVFPFGFSQAMRPILFADSALVLL